MVRTEEGYVPSVLTLWIQLIDFRSEKSGAVFQGITVCQQISAYEEYGIGTIGLMHDWE